MERPSEINLPILGIIHKYAKDNYLQRYPELDSLVQQPLDFLKTVKVSCLHSLLELGIVLIYNITLDRSCLATKFCLTSAMCKCFVLFRTRSCVDQTRTKEIMSVQRGLYIMQS